MTWVGRAPHRLRYPFLSDTYDTTFTRSPLSSTFFTPSLSEAHPLLSAPCPPKSHPPLDRAAKELSKTWYLVPGIMLLLLLYSAVPLFLYRPEDPSSPHTNQAPFGVSS